MIGSDAREALRVVKEVICCKNVKHSFRLQGGRTDGEKVRGEGGEEGRERRGERGEEREERTRERTRADERERREREGGWVGEEGGGRGRVVVVVEGGRRGGREGRRVRGVFFKQPEAVGNSAGTRAHASVGSGTLPSAPCGAISKRLRAVGKHISFAGLVAKNLTHAERCEIVD